MTNKELRKIAEKMTVVTTMLNEVQEILGKEDFEMSYKTPAHVELMHAVDLADLAKIAKKKIQLKKSCGGSLVEFCADWHDFVGELFGGLFEFILVG